MKSGSVCYKHKDRSVDYYCEKCVNLFCVVCFEEHNDANPSHLSYNFKERAVKITKDIVQFVKVADGEEIKGNSSDSSKEINKVISEEIELIKKLEKDILKITGSAQDYYLKN